MTRVRRAKFGNRVSIPFRQYLAQRNEIWAWLEGNLGSIWHTGNTAGRWTGEFREISSGTGGRHVEFYVFEFQDSQQAMLFKLTWL